MRTAPSLLGRARAIAPTVEAGQRPAGRGRGGCAGAPYATRSISSASVGTSVPCTLATSGIRRTMPRVGVDRDQAPARWPGVQFVDAGQRAGVPHDAASRRRSGAARFAWTVIGGARSGVDVASLVAGEGRARRAPRRARRRAPRRWRACFAARRRPSVRAPSASASSRSGDSASASGIRMSSPIAAGSRAVDARRPAGQLGARPRPLADGGAGSSGRPRRR